MVASSGGCYLLEGIWAPEQILFVVTVIELEFKNSNQESQHSARIKQVFPRCPSKICSDISDYGVLNRYSGQYMFQNRMNNQIHH